MKSRVERRVSGMANGSQNQDESYHITGKREALRGIS
jgi:hypothetical protein